MGGPVAATEAPRQPPPPASALQQLLEGQTSQSSPHPPHLQHLALQVLHNLQHQHDWTDLRIHTHSTEQPPAPHPANTRKRKRLLPRPLVSGLPPQRLYIHPDEQIALLQAQKKSGGTGLGDVGSEREWVLPTHLREKWSLRRFADVFGAVGVVPPPFVQGDAEGSLGEVDADADDEEESNGLAVGASGARAATIGDLSTGRRRPDDLDDEQQVNPWRTTKRLLLATLDDDSTVVYYIVHDGIVKPRQN